MKVSECLYTLKTCSIDDIDYQLAEQLELDLDYSDETSDYRTTDFPARYIYERVLNTIVGKLSNIYYHRSSPYSGHGQPTTDQTLGDLHQCAFRLVGKRLRYLSCCDRERMAWFTGTVAQLG
jgi:hypothetical protein